MEASKILPTRLRQILEQPAVARFLARWSIGAGALSALFVLAMTVGYFAFEIPFRDGDTGLPATPAKVLVVLFVLAIGATLCIYSGLRRLKRLRELN